MTGTMRVCVKSRAMPYRNAHDIQVQFLILIVDGVLTFMFRASSEIFVNSLSFKTQDEIDFLNQCLCLHGAQGRMLM